MCLVLYFSLSRIFNCTKKLLNLKSTFHIFFIVKFREYGKIYESDRIWNFEKLGNTVFCKKNLRKSLQKIQQILYFLRNGMLTHLQTCTVIVTSVAESQQHTAELFLSRAGAELFSRHRVFHYDCKTAAFKPCFTSCLKFLNLVANFAASLSKEECKFKFLTLQ